MSKKSNAPQYLQLNRGGTVARMAVLKMALAANNQGRPPSMQWAAWRDARKWTFKNWGAAFCDLAQGFDRNKTPIWYAHTGEQFRNETDVHELDGTRVKHRGWYSDMDCRDKVIGIVASLSHGRFIAGYRWTSNDERVYYGEVYSDVDRASSYADHYAEKFAELCRDDDEEFQAALTLQNNIDESLTRLRECLVLRHVKRMDYVKSEISELIETIREKRETLKVDYAGVL